HLHSFPTRRSSDLSSWPAASGRTAFCAQTSALSLLPGWPFRGFSTAIWTSSRAASVLFWLAPAFLSPMSFSSSRGEWPHEKVTSYFVRHCCVAPNQRSRFGDLESTSNV